MFVIEDQDGERFGYYYNGKLKSKDNRNLPDSKTFHFNLHSLNNRLHQPMKFKSIEHKYGGCKMFTNVNQLLISLGNINLMKCINGISSTVEEYDEHFDYQGISNAICGRTRYEEEEYWEGEHFIPKKITVIQMK